MIRWAMIAFVFAGCRAELPGGYYGCRDGNCPPGQYCDARDQRCYKEDVPDGDGGQCAADGGDC